MNKIQLKTVIREFLSSDKDSYVIGDKYKNTFLNKRQEYINALLKNKKNLVKRYGKDAEKVLTGRAINDAKKYIEDMKKQDLKELVRKSLMKEDNNDLLSQLESALKSHDWYYRMSDDDRAYQKGTQEESELKKIAKQLVDMGYGKDAADIYNQYNVFDKISFESFIAPRQPFIPMYKRKQMDLDETEFSKEFDNDPALKGGQKKLPDALQKSIIKKEKGVKEDIDLGHEDNEPHMIKSELYRIGKYAIELYKMVDGFEGKGEVDFPAWWQSKITTSMNNMVSAKHYLDFELKEPAIDAMVNITSDEEVIDEKKLTPAEKKKKEEIVKSMKKDFKGPKPAMYAIATDKAKDLAEMIAKKLQNK